MIYLPVLDIQLHWTEILWVIAPAFGGVICWIVLHKALRDKHWFEAQYANGPLIRDASAAVQQEGLRVLAQAILFVAGILRATQDPPPPQWDALELKMLIGSAAIICVSLILSISAVQDLRLRRLQQNDMVDRPPRGSSPSKHT